MGTMKLIGNRLGKGTSCVIVEKQRLFQQYANADFFLNP